MVWHIQHYFQPLQDLIFSTCKKQDHFTILCYNIFLGSAIKLNSVVVKKVRIILNHCLLHYFTFVGLCLESILGSVSVQEGTQLCVEMTYVPLQLKKNGVLWALPVNSYENSAFLFCGQISLFCLP